MRSKRPASTDSVFTISDRTQYINLVIATGADVKTAQALSRHSTPYLTMEVYGEAVDTRLIHTAELVGNMINQAYEEAKGVKSTGEATGFTADAGKWPKSAQVPEIGIVDKKGTPCIAWSSNEKYLVPAGGIE